MSQCFPVCSNQLTMNNKYSVSYKSVILLLNSYIVFHDYWSTVARLHWASVNPIHVSVLQEALVQGQSPRDSVSMRREGAILPDNHELVEECLVPRALQASAFFYPPDTSSHIPQPSMSHLVGGSLLTTGFDEDILRLKLLLLPLMCLNETHAVAQVWKFKIDDTILKQRLKHLTKLKWDDATTNHKSSTSQQTTCDRHKQQH